MSEQLANELKEVRKVIDELSEIKKRIENTLTVMIDKHFPYADFNCHVEPQIDRDSENNREYLQCKVEFPGYYGSFTLSELTELQKEIGASEIAVVIPNNSPVSLIIGLPILPPFQ